MSTDIDFSTKRSGRAWNVYLHSLDPKVPIILDPDAFRKKGINFNTEELSFEEYQTLANSGLNTESIKLSDKFKTSVEWADIYNMKTNGFTAWEEAGKDYNKDKISFREFRELFVKYKY